MAQKTRVKRLGTAVATFAVALTIGYVMQYGDADASRSASEGVVIVESSILPIDTSPLEETFALAPKVPADVQRNDQLERAVRVDSESMKLTALVAEAANTSLFRTIDVSDPDKQSEALGCDVDVAASLGPNASVLISVDSACRASSAFEVHHNGMTFSAVTDAGGSATITVPALEVNASIFVNFSDGGGAAVTAVVPEAQNFNRVVLQWKGAPAELIQLSNVGLSAAGELRRFGFYTGDESRFAEVYTFPANYPVGKGIQDLTVQASVSTDTCGQELTAERFNVIPGASPAFKDIRITLPDCEQVGTFLELKKVLGGQTILP